MLELEGRPFANYEILAKLGEGGMGAVYKARQPLLNRFVALKVMAPHLAADREFVARFQREATAAANLNHPNIVQLYTAGEQDGTHFIAMEFVDGESVRQRLARSGRLDPAEALAIGVYVAEALNHAWKRGRIIHRDIKPDNIYLSQAGEVKLGDLGLAKTVGGETTAGLTQTGVAMGSPHYVSPEQAQGRRDLDFRADIYSLGCTLYHLVTGQTPYDGADALSVMNKHINEPPPAIFKVWPTCPMPLAMLVGKMVKKNPRERHASYEELIAEMIAVRDKLEKARTIAAAPPSGTITFLFTDIEGSSQLWERHPQAMPIALERHNQILRQAAESHGGFVFKTVGDAFCVAFTVAGHALAAAMAAQRALAAEPWGETGPLRVRMGLHTGEAEARDGDYFGPALNRVARVLSAGHGGQILLSQATEQLVRDHLTNGVSLQDKGERSLKNLSRTERIFQLTLPELQVEFPTLRAAAVAPAVPAPKAPVKAKQTVWVYAAAGAAVLAVVGSLLLWAPWKQNVGGASVPRPSETSAQSRGAEAPPTFQSTAPAAYPQPRAWIDATEEVRSKGLKDGSLVADGEWLEATKTTWPSVGHGERFGNVAVRVVFSNKAGVKLRYTREAYTGGVASNHRRIAFENQTGARTDLDDHVDPGTNEEDGAHELLFAAQGDKLSLWLDGKEVAHATDGRLTSGKMQLSLYADGKTKPSRIKKVEYGELDPPGYPQPRAWIDATERLRNLGLTDGSLVSNGEWLALADSGKGRFIELSNDSFRDVAVRVVFSNKVNVFLRKSDKKYRGEVWQDGAIIRLIGHSSDKSDQILLKAADNEPGYVPEAEHEMVFAVQGAKLSLWLDGKEVASATDQTLQTGKMEIALLPDKRHPPRVKKVEYGELPAPTATSATENWQDWMADQRRAGKTPGGFRDGGAGWETTKDFAVAYIGDSIRDGAVRATFPFMDPPCALSLRRKGGIGYYQVLAEANGISLYRWSKGKTKTVLKRWPLPLRLDPKEDITIEFRAVGDELSVKLNGGLVGSVRDDAYREGVPMFYAPMQGTRVSRIEVLNLDKLAAADAAPPTVKQWVDVTNKVTERKKVEPLTSEVFRDVALRARFKGTAGLQLFLREQNQKFYRLVFNKSVSKIYLASASTVTDAKALVEGSHELGNDSLEHELIFAAKGDELSVWLDGKHISTARDNTLTEGVISCYLRDDVTLTKLEYGEIAAANAGVDDAFIKEVAALPAEEQGWIKIFGPDSMRNSWSNGVMLLQGMVRSKTIHSRDVALRATVRLTKDALEPPEIGVRLNGTSGENESRLLLVLESADQIVLRLKSRPAGIKTTHILKSWDLGPSVKDGDWVPIEFRVVGDEITVSVNGRTLGTVRNQDVMDSGGVMIYSKGTPMRDIAYLPLDAPASAGAPDAFIKEVAALPAQEQVKRVVAKLKELNPGYGGKEVHKIENGQVTELDIREATDFSDLSPVRALTHLRRLVCNGYKPPDGKQAIVQLRDLSPLRGLPLEEVMFNSSALTDLSPLQGLPLSFLSVAGSSVHDLTPLRGMPLKKLAIHNTKIHDFSPLRDTPVEWLLCAPHIAAQPANRKVLEAIKTLQTINNLPAAEFWREIDAGKFPGVDGPSDKKRGHSGISDDAFIKEVAALPAEQQVKRVVAKLKELNPGWDGKETHQIEDGQVVELYLSTIGVTDISPLRALEKLQKLECKPFRSNRPSPLKDLSPLKGLKLNCFSCDFSQVEDLQPLAGMPLTKLYLPSTQVKDLAPLRGMKLEDLSCIQTAVHDLSPLEGMPLRSFFCGRSEVADLAPLRGSPVTMLKCEDARVTDLSPLKGKALRILACDIPPLRAATFLRSMKTLYNINDLPAQEFWKQLDEADAAQKGK